MSIQIAQIRIVLDEVRKNQGVETVAAILKKVDAIDAGSIDPADYPQVMRLCGHAELASGTMTCRSDDQDKGDVPGALNALARAHYGKGKPTPSGDFQTIVAGAKSVAEGFDFIGRALNAGRKDVAS